MPKFIFLSELIKFRGIQTYWILFFGKYNINSCIGVIYTWRNSNLYMLTSQFHFTFVYHDHISCRTDAHQELRISVNKTGFLTKKHDFKNHYIKHDGNSIWRMLAYGRAKICPLYYSVKEFCLSGMNPHL